IPTQPRLKPFSRALGTPENVWQSRAANPPGHKLVADVDIADGHLALHNLDLKVPEGGAWLSFERVFNNQNNELRPLGIGWTHSWDAFVLEEDAGRYTVVVGGQSYEFPVCTVSRDQTTGKPFTVQDCVTDKDHGGQMKVSITNAAANSAGQLFKFEFIREGDRAIYVFDRPAQRDERE